MRLTRRNVADVKPAVTASKGRNGSLKPRAAKPGCQPRASRPKTRAMVLDMKENEETSHAVGSPADENTPVNSTNRSSRSTLAEEKNADVPLSNTKILRSRSRSSMLSRREVLGAASMAGAASSAKSKAMKKTEIAKRNGEKTEKAVRARDPVPKRTATTNTTSSGRDEALVSCSPVNIVSEMSRTESIVPPEEPDISATVTEKETGGGPRGRADERVVAHRKSPMLSKPIVAPKAFYGQAASPTDAGDIQQRLKELSFNRRASFVESPAPSKKKRNPRPRAFKVAQRGKLFKNSKDCCGQPVILVGGAPKEGTAFTLSTVNEARHGSLESKKFFKHHVPIGQFRCVIRNGVPKFVAAPKRGTAKGLIDFDFKEDKIAHVAEEGGKCNNFGLTSVEDLQRSGIPKVSILQDNRFNLRKRTSTFDMNQKPQKRRRASSWRYAEEDAPSQSFSSGRSPESPGEFEIKTRDDGVHSIALQQRFRSRRAKVTAAVRDESTILVKETTPDPTLQLGHGVGNLGGETLRNTPNCTDAASRDAPVAKRTGASRDRDSRPEPNKVAAPAEARVRINKSGVGGRKNDCKIPDAASEDALGAEPPRASNDKDVLQRSASRRSRNLPAATEPGIEQPSLGSIPAHVDLTHIDFSSVDCDSPRLSPSPPSSPPPPSPPRPAPGPGCSRKATRKLATSTPLLAQLDRNHSRQEPNADRPYNPLDDAFGFGRMRFKARSDFENPFVEVPSPTKKPKELEPKIMALRSTTQPSVSDALKKAAGTLVTSTPTKKDVSIRLSEVGGAGARFTSTPWDPTEKRGFYGASSTSTTSMDGFKGLRRLIDRLGSKQLQIDAGQKAYGAKECKTCGMIFSQGEAEDEREHQKFHKRMDSVLQVRHLGSCRVVDVLPGVGRAVLISAQDSKRVREKLSDVLEFANRTVGLASDVVGANFYTHPKRTFAAFVHDSGKIVSVIGAEPCSLAHRTVPGQGLLVDSSKRHLVKSSILFIWTLPEFRRKGLAALLLYRMRVILGAQEEPLTFDELAFADLTSDLHKFVTALSGQVTVLVAAPPDPNLEALL